MGISTQELLRKATMTTTDFGGAGEAPLSIEQVDQFLILLSLDQALLPEVRKVTSSAAKWQESILDLNVRMMKPGVEATRLADADRVKPTTGVVEISTVLIRGEAPVSDEVMEDQIARAGFADNLMKVIASRVGQDVEDLMLNGDVLSADPYLAQLDGWIKQARTGVSANTVNAASLGQDYQTIFNQLILALPDRFKRNLTDFRYYVPQRLVEKYRDQLAARGTPMGDLMLTGTNELRYQGILIKPVPISAITAATPDTANILLAHRSNLYAGFHRQVTFEKWRDPREGATSFVVSARVDAKVAVVDATALAFNVNVEPV